MVAVKWSLWLTGLWYSAKANYYYIYSGRIKLGLVPFLPRKTTNCANEDHNNGKKRQVLTWIGVGIFIGINDLDFQLKQLALKENVLEFIHFRMQSTVQLVWYLSLKMEFYQNFFTVILHLFHYPCLCSSEMLKKIIMHKK